MRSIFIHFLLLLGLSVYCDILTAQKLITFPDIPGRIASDKYQCRIRILGSEEWDSAFVIQTKCKNNPDENTPPTGPDNGYFKMLDSWSASFIAFEFENTSVEVEISKVGGAPIVKAMVRPVGHASAAEIRDGKAYIIFTKQANINVDIDGQMEDKYTGMDYSGPTIHTISLFGNPIYKEPNSTNPRVIALDPGQSIPTDFSKWDTIFFKPGVHNIGTPYTIQSNKVLYIPGNAIVHGTIHPKNAWGNDASKNWSVYGSGTISGENIVWTGDENKSAKTFTYQAESARMEGFVVLDPANHTFNMGHTGPNENVNVYKNIKIFGWRKNSDGINAFKNSVITDCFIRVQDDVFYYGGDNVKISNIVTWNDANGAVLYVTKGATTMDMSYFKDIKVIYHRAYWHYWDGGRVISFRDRQPGNTIKNVQIRNVLIEDPYSAFPPFFLKMGNPDNSTAAVTMDNIIIENVRQEHPAVTLPGRAATRNTMLGLDATRKFKNITFKNCYYNKKWVGGFEDGNFLTNNYTENISFLLDSVKHQISVSVKDEMGGTVSGGGTFTHGLKTSVMAMPAAGYKFAGWLQGSDTVSVKQQYIFTVTKELEITAVFTLVIVKYNINLTVNDIAGGTVAGNGSYVSGNNATLSAVPANGYIFSGWMIDAVIVSTNPQYTFPVIKDLEIKAVFTLTTNISDQSDIPFKIYPNPASDKLFVHSDNKAINKIQLTDLTGKVIYTKGNVSQNETIDIFGLISGLYVIQVYTADTIFTSKIIIE